MEKHLIKKGLIITIIILFLCTDIVSAFNLNFSRIYKHIDSGSWLYVGGDGLENYTKIQDAIDNATDGDTVFVFNGTYYEEVNVYKRINLIGENRVNTIINSLTNISSTVLVITADYVKIQNFTITSKNNSIKSTYGIKIESSYCNISNCNIIENSFIGIAFFGKSNHNTIYRNIIKKCSYGTYIGFDQSCSCFNVIKQNNFIETRITFSLSFCNYWIGNYYDTWIGIGPKIIWGHGFILPWVNFDWHPAKKPYDIEG